MVSEQSILGHNYGFNPVTTPDMMKMMVEFPILSSNSGQYALYNQPWPPPAPPHLQLHPFYTGQYSSPSWFYQYNNFQYTAPQVFDEMTVRNLSPTHTPAIHTSPYTLTVQTTLSTGQPYFAIEPTTVFEDANSFGDLRPVGMDVCETDDKHEVVTVSAVKHDVGKVNKSEARIGCEVEFKSETGEGKAINDVYEVDGSIEIEMEVARETKDINEMVSDKDKDLDVVEIKVCCEDGDKNVETDAEKMTPPLLHLAFQALDKFISEFGRFLVAGTEEDTPKLISIVDTLNESVGDGKITDIDPKLLRPLSFGAVAVLSSMAAMCGGIVGQEVRKACPGKFHPLFQFLYFDLIESLSTEPLEVGDLEPLSNRYDAQILVFDAKVQKRLEGAQVFIVGSGALGSKFLKSLTLMGVLYSKQEKLTVIDDDVIEKSNLSRQILFYDCNIGQANSMGDATVAAMIDLALRIEALQNRGGLETKNVFDESLWGNLSVVVNALDNFNFRLYVDRVFPSLSSSFQIISKEQCGGESFLTLSNHPSFNKRSSPEILIGGLTWVELLSGLHWYLKYWCGAHISWDKTGGIQLASVPNTGSLPRIQVVGILMKRPVPWNYYQNAVTSSYSFAWWDWERWEKEIDWMAHQGINLVLAFTGQEAIWQKVFQTFNITSSELSDFFGGSAKISVQIFDPGGVLVAKIILLPRHDEKWQPKSNVVENSHQPTEVILKKKVVVSLGKRKKNLTKPP